MMECWNHGFKGILSNQNGFFDTFYPLFHCSKIPLFQMNGIMEAIKIL
jgi:hypothetical protein